MEFWGVQVASGKPHKVELDDGHAVHLSHVTLGDLKKYNNDPVIVYVEVGEEKKKFVLGLLSKNTPQLSFDLIFKQSFQISHNWKNGSVHLLGYQIHPDEHETDFGADSSDDEEEVPVDAKPAAPAVSAVKATKDNNAKLEDDDDSDEEEDDSDDEMVGSDDSDEGEDSEEDDEDDSEDEEPPKVEQVKQSKKRPNADAKTPDSKKVKLVTPLKTEGKKGVHPATPHPSKKEGKTPGGDKATPKTSQVSCTPCKKTFGTTTALESHNKAKHSAAK